METLMALPEVNMRVASLRMQAAFAAQTVQLWIEAPTREKWQACRGRDLVTASERFAEQGAGPGGDEAEDKTAAGVERGQEKCAGAQRDERLPLVGREGRVGADEAHGNEIAPGGIEVGALAEVGNRQADDEAGSD